MKKKTSNETAETEIVRCGWLNENPLYITYHDEEWGRPQRDSVRLFEMLCLEGQQAGLSWITILKKRENYRKIFHNFNPHKISKFTSNDVKNILKDPGIVRHRGKIEAIINNSKCYLKMESNGEEFSDFIWSFVKNKPVINKWVLTNQVPTESSVSIALSKALKKRGFKYVGSTICYAFMQACGLINDHIVSCVCHEKVKDSK